MKIALLSVSNKAGIVDFAREISTLGFDILSTGGTAKTLREAGISVVEVAQHTGQPEILDGRVKTLHPKIHGGILARRNHAQDMSVLAQQDIKAIDLVVVNLYPFEATIEGLDSTWENAIENIDIGGPAMVRASAKNHQDVNIVVDPSDYTTVLNELKQSQSSGNPAQTSLATRQYLAQKAFAHTARYDAAISQYFLRHNQCELADNSGSNNQQISMFSKEFTLGGQLMQNLRYGENPHQQAALFRSKMLQCTQNQSTLLDFEQIQGKELSFNNIVDADAAWGCVRSFNYAAKQASGSKKACVIVKHANPCGVALGQTNLEAYQKAFKTDATSAFGGIIAFNHELDELSAQAVVQQFLEVLIAPSYTEAALAVLKTKPNVRVLKVPMGERAGYELRQVDGGFLVQTLDVHQLDLAHCKTVSQRVPHPAQWEDMMFAWHVAKWVKSNAIIFAKDGMTLGIGAGQMSRVDSAKIAAIKAAHAGLSLTNCVASSDAFFPFRDGLDVLIGQGACAVISPGGSMRDDEVIRSADEQNAALVFTGVRHFRH
jgi:phosphoribosylaminoimidazolecarboxamide formyltransferase/IMP cyclohydrolase